MLASCARSSGFLWSLWISLAEGQEGPLSLASVSCALIPEGCVHHACMTLGLALFFMSLWQIPISNQGFQSLCPTVLPHLGDLLSAFHSQTVTPSQMGSSGKKQS